MAGVDPEYEEPAQLSTESEVADPDYGESVVDVVLVIKPEPAVVISPDAGFAFKLGRAVLPLT